MSDAFPDVEPWTDLDDDRLLTQTLKARSLHPHLVQMNQEELERWVSAARPSQILSFVDCASDGLSGTERGLVQFGYAELVHCRPEVSTRRVAHVAHHFLHQHNVDPGVVEVERLEPKSWATTLDAAGKAPNDPLRAAKWYMDVQQPPVGHMAGADGLPPW